jgi:hypothetical protein
MGYQLNLINADSDSHFILPFCSWYVNPMEDRRHGSLTKDEEINEVDIPTISQEVKLTGLITRPHGWQLEGQRYGRTSHNQRILGIC